MASLTGVPPPTNRPRKTGPQAVGGRAVAQREHVIDERAKRDPKVRLIETVDPVQQGRLAWGRKSPQLFRAFGLREFQQLRNMVIPRGAAGDVPHGFGAVGMLDELSQRQNADQGGPVMQLIGCGRIKALR